MTITDNILVPPPNITGTEGNSDSFFLSAIIFKNNKYAVQGQKFGEDFIYWDVEELGFVITSNSNPIVFSNNELNNSEINQNISIWHTPGILLKN